MDILPGLMPKYPLFQAIHRNACFSETPEGMNLREYNRFGCICQRFSGISGIFCISRRIAGGFCTDKARRGPDEAQPKPGLMDNLAVDGRNIHANNLLKKHSMQSMNIYSWRRHLLFAPLDKSFCSPHNNCIND